jgi:hypothetical protein
VTTLLLSNFPFVPGGAFTGSGAISGHLTSPPTDPGLLQVPTTIAEFGNRLYAVNARFNLPEADRPTAAYSVVQLRKAR